jgi:hypothetical protein
MNRLLLIFALFIFFSCRSNETKNAVVAVSDKPAIAKIGTVRRDKFSLPIQYDKFNVDTFTGKRVGINYSSNKTAQRFRSAINWSIEKFGMNFAGHYNLARWGCGTSCIKGAITDFKTGNVYDLPPASVGYAFQNKSRLLVINPPDSSGYYDDCSYCEPELWVWNENMKKFEKLNLHSHNKKSIL